MTLITIRCSGCDTPLGKLTNLFVQIGKGYISSLISPDRGTLSVSTAGDVREGDIASIVGGCQLQDAECVECYAHLGQKCIKAPVKHILKQGQLIFRTSSISLRLTQTGRRTVEPNIERVLKIKTRNEAAPEHAAAPEPQARDDGAEVLQLQADINAQREDINRISATGYQIVSSFDTNIARVDQRMLELNTTIDSIRQDQESSKDGLASLKSEVLHVKAKSEDSSIMSKMEAQMQTTNRIVQELRSATEKSKTENQNLRKEIHALQKRLQTCEKDNVRFLQDSKETKRVLKANESATQEYTTQVSAFRREIQQLRGELAKERQPEPPRPNEQVMSSQELDILTSHISKVGDRASRVEPLEMNFALLKRRVEQMEAREMQTSGRERGDKDHRAIEMPQGPDTIIVGQKRLLSAHNEHDFGSPRRRQKLVTSDYSSAGTTGSTNDAIWEPSSPPLPGPQRGNSNSTAKRAGRRPSGVRT